MNPCGVIDWKVTPHPAILERVHNPVNRLPDFKDSIRGNAFDAAEFRGRVRRHPFVVSDVRISDLPVEMSDPGLCKEHFVTLSSVEDEARLREPDGSMRLEVTLCPVHMIGRKTPVSIRPSK